MKAITKLLALLQRVQHITKVFIYFFYYHFAQGVTHRHPSLYFKGYLNTIIYILFGVENKYLYFLIIIYKGIALHLHFSNSHYYTPSRWKYYVEAAISFFF